MSLNQSEKQETPWQRVFAKFGMSRADFAKALGRHRSKLSRALKDEKGLINGSDQERIIDVAGRLKVNITADDLMPGRR